MVLIEQQGHNNNKYGDIKLHNFFWHWKLKIGYAVGLPSSWLLKKKRAFTLERFSPSYSIN